MNLTLCPDSVANFLGFFDLTIAPPLLLYSYVPIFLLSVFFGFFVFHKDGTFVSRYFLGITLSFASWILLILFQWTGIYLQIVGLAWQLLLLPEISIYIFSVLFAYAFLFKKDVPLHYKYSCLFFVGFAATIMPTKWNVAAFDLNNCEGSVGIFWSMLYIFEWICLTIIIFITNHRIKKVKKGEEQIKIVLFSFGLTLFLAIFWVTNYFGEITKMYEINLIGPLGMVLFLSILSYMMVRFKSFNIKLISSQVLVLALSILIGALLFMHTLTYIRIVVAFTLTLVSILGFNLIKSVKREIEQREKIERLASDLKNSNLQLQDLDRQKDELLGIVAHQLAKPITAIRWDLESLLDGDMGNLNPKQQEEAKTMKAQAVNLADLVSMILDVSRIQLGKMHLEAQPLDLNQLFKEMLEVIKPTIAEKKIDFVKKMPANLPTVILDKRYTRMTIQNLLTNAVKYTPEGGKVTLDVKIENGVMHCKISDTGCGIPKADQGKIFGKMYRASNVVNLVDGNGFGLYVAKGAVEGQGGTIGFESTEGKGTTFFFTLPMKEVSKGKE